MDSASLPAVLNYAPFTATAPHRVVWRATSLVACVPAVAAFFVTFVWGVSPLSEIIDSLSHSPPNWMMLLLACPFGLAFPMSLWKLRLLFWPGSASGERIVACVLAGMVAAMPVAFVTAGLLDSASVVGEIWPALAMPFPILLSAWPTLWLARRRAVSRESIATIAMLIAYTASVSMPLTAFRDSTDIGWYLTLMSVFFAAMETLLVLFVHPARVATTPRPPCPFLAVDHGLAHNKPAVVRGEPPLE